jgi:hypothetical protein
MNQDSEPAANSKNDVGTVGEYWYQQSASPHTVKERSAGFGTVVSKV